MNADYQVLKLEIEYLKYFRPQSVRNDKPQNIVRASPSKKVVSTPLGLWFDDDVINLYITGVKVI